MNIIASKEISGHYRSVLEALGVSMIITTAEGNIVKQALTEDTKEQDFNTLEVGVRRRGISVSERLLLGEPCTS